MKITLALLFSVLVFCFASKSESNPDQVVPQFSCFIKCNELPGFNTKDYFQENTITIPLTKIDFNDVCQGIGRSCACAKRKTFLKNLLGSSEYQIRLEEYKTKCNQNLLKKFVPKQPKVTLPTVKPVPKKGKIENVRDCKDGVCCVKKVECFGKSDCKVLEEKCDKKPKEGIKYATLPEKITKKPETSGKKKLTKICITLDEGQDPQKFIANIKSRNPNQESKQVVQGAKEGNDSENKEESDKEESKDGEKEEKEEKKGKKEKKGSKKGANKGAKGSKGNKIVKANKPKKGKK